MEQFTLIRKDDGTLQFSSGGHSEEAVRVTQSFPLSAPNRFLSVRAADGKELAFIEDIEPLNDELRTTLLDELELRSFMPRVTRVQQITTTPEGLRVSIETDRGSTTILLDSDEHIRRLPEGRIVLVDHDGVRYLIPDAAALDSVSRNKLEHFH